MIELMGLILALVLVISGIVLFFLFFQATSQPASKSKRFSPPQSSKPSSDRINLEKRILTLLYGDKKVASRLVNSIQKKFPEKDRKWCLEKVISDLEKDRR